jgi:hypothetical protein
MAMNFPDGHWQMHIRISPDIQVVINLPRTRVDSVSTFGAPNTAALRPVLTQASGRQLKLPRAPASITLVALE